MALVSGIYPRTILALRALWARSSYRALLPKPLAPSGIWPRVLAFIRAIDGFFLLTLLAAMLPAVYFGASILTGAWRHYPGLVSAFLLGLVATSAIRLWQISLAAEPSLGLASRGKKETAKLVLKKLPLVLLGAGFGFLPKLLGGAPSQGALVLVPAGFAAAFLMLVPGVSGAAFLLAIGLYQRVLAAIASFDLAFLLPLGIGFAVGLLAGTAILSWLLKLKFYPKIQLFFIGLMLASLSSLWPWQGLALGDPALYDPTSILDWLESLSVIAMGGVLALALGSKPASAKSSPAL